jgi:signal transduction histidine kinase
MRSITVLVAACDDRATKVTASALEELGYAVPATFNSGEALLQQISQYQPDLILSDIQLTGAIDGITTATIVQQRHNIPVVYLTDQMDANTRERICASRPFGYVNQPRQSVVDPLILATAIDIALARHQAEHHQAEHHHQTALTHGQHQSNQTVQTEYLATAQAEYLAIAAHELRNPLGVVRSVAELLTSSEIELSAERRNRYLQRLLTASDNLDELLQSMLTYSYAKAGKLDSTPTAIDLVEFCTAQVERLQTSSSQHQFIFNKQTPSCPSFLDPELMSHLLTNLLTNAVKYSPHPDDSEASHTHKPITIDLQWTGKTATISIADQGIGIPIEAQSRLFEPFYRADNALNIPGTGLGLALSQHCAQRLGGNIEYDRDYHPGARFIVHLPIDSRPPL